MPKFFKEITINGFSSYLNKLVKGGRDTHPRKKNSQKINKTLDGRCAL